MKDEKGGYAQRLCRQYRMISAVLAAVMATDFAAEHGDVLDGLILFAAYPTSQLPSGMTEILLVGSEDGVINWDKIEEGRQYAPSRYTEHVIRGGNHAQFGSYGSQKGDGTATILGAQQVKESVDIIMENLHLSETGRQGAKK